MQSEQLRLTDRVLQSVIERDVLCLLVIFCMCFTSLQCELISELVSIVPYIHVSCCADGITLSVAERAGVFRLAQYGPINSLSTRTNEIMLAVQL